MLYVLEKSQIIRIAPPRILIFSKTKAWYGSVETEGENPKYCKTKVVRHPIFCKTKVSRITMSTNKYHHWTGHTIVLDTASKHACLCFGPPGIEEHAIKHGLNDKNTYGEYLKMWSSSLDSDVHRTREIDDAVREVLLSRVSINGSDDKLYRGVRHELARDCTTPNHQSPMSSTRTLQYQPHHCSLNTE
jgi:hypothetical protein